MIHIYTHTYVQIVEKLDSRLMPICLAMSPTCPHPVPKLSTVALLKQAKWGKWNYGQCCPLHFGGRHGGAILGFWFWIWLQKVGNISTVEICEKSVDINWCSSMFILKWCVLLWFAFNVVNWYFVQFDSGSRSLCWASFQKSSQSSKCGYDFCWVKVSIGNNTILIT